MIDKNPHNEYFDIDAANRERLDARLGGKPWTERAAGRDESLRRDIADEVKKELGNRASTEAAPEQ